MSRPLRQGLLSLLVLLGLAAPVSGQDVTADAQDEAADPSGGVDARVVEEAVDVTPAAADADPDEAATQRLRAIFAAVDEFSELDISVASGVASLGGTAPSTEVHEQAVELTRNTEGVVYVDDSVSEPVAVADRLAPIRQRAEGWAASTIDRLPLIAIALLAFFAFVGLGRFLGRRKRWIAKVVKRPIFREVASKTVSLGFAILGLLIALQILDAVALVGTILGAAGVLGLALGFAFRDIVENYLASFLLAARRPFSPGDAVKIEDHEGKIVRLTMRETVLMTFDGNHVSLPNASVFKSAVLNYTRNPKRRFDFVVGAGVDTDLSAARRLGVDTLRATAGVLDEPAPHSVIEALGDSNVAVRFYGWVDQNEADFQKARSEAIRRVKTALEDAGVDMPEPIYRVHLSQAAEAQAPAQERSRAESAVERDEEQADVGVDESIDKQIAESSEPHEDDEDLLAA